MISLVTLVVMVAIAVVVARTEAKTAETEVLEPLRISVRVDEDYAANYRGGRRF